MSSDVGFGNYAAVTSVAETERGHGPAMSARTPDGVESVADIVARTRRDPFPGWTVPVARTLTCSGEGGSPDVLGVPVIGDLDCVADHATRCQYIAVSVASKPARSGHRLHQLAWDLEGAGVASGVG